MPWWGITLIVIGALIVLFSLSLVLKGAPIIGPVFEIIADIGCAVGEGIGEMADNIDFDGDD